MADNHHHHHHHRPSRISLPPRTTSPTITTTPRSSHPFLPYPPATPTPTPSKHRRALSAKSSTNLNLKTSSLSFFLLLLFSLRSLYSLLPFLRASPSSFSIFPFAFLVSLLSFLLTLSFSLFTSIYRKPHQPIFSLSLITLSQHKLLLVKSLLLAVVFLLRFQALQYCGTAAMILAELSGNLVARFISEGNNRSLTKHNQIGSSQICGYIALFSGLILLSISWDRIECFPLSSVNMEKSGFSVFPGGNCIRIWPMLLPFLSGFLGCYERISMKWGIIRELGRKRVRLMTLFFTTAMLFIPAVISMFVFEAEGDSVSVLNLGWPLANTVLFGVLLSENSTDEKFTSSKDFQREYFITFVCTLLLELFYFPELSLWGLLVCGLLLWVAVRELDPVYNDYLELGYDYESPESFTTVVIKPLRHILSERKSRKIALFLLINTAYMVVEFFVGFMSNSLGLISDACHMLFDCAALAIGLYASYISRLPANSQFNYGRGRFEVLSGYVNAVFLVLVGALIVLESLERIMEPQEISTGSILSVSIGGLLVNVVGLIFFHEEHHHAHGGSGPCSHSHSGDDTDGKDVVGSKGALCTHDDHHHDDQHNVDHHHDHNHVDQLNHHDDDHDHHHIDQHNHHHHDDHQHDHHRIDEHNHHQHHHDHHHVDQHNHHGYHHNAEQHHHHHLDLDHSHTEILLDKERTNKPHHHHHHHVDHNMQGIFLHVLADTMGSVGVVISTLLIKYKGWLVADPACSIFISALIIASVIPLLRNSAEILLQRVPRAYEQDLKEALNKVMKLKGVCGIQNLHVWSFTNTDVVGTVHLHVPNETKKASAKKLVSDILHHAGIKDLTLQVECVDCNL